MASRRSVRRTTVRTPKPTPEKQRPSGRRTFIVITLVFLAVIAVSIVIGFYFLVWKDLWRPVLRVNDETINMDYLLRRLEYYNNTYGTYDIDAMLITIIKEEVIRQRVPDYYLEVTPDEIDERLRDTARGENETISESEFNVWYRNELNATRLSDAEYRELTETYILREQLEEYLRANVPTEIEQVHLYVIFLQSGEDAYAALDRIADGEDFSELAQEISVDEESAEQGGDIGWWPYLGGLPENLEFWAFSLEVGQVSDVIGLDEEGQIYAICMVVERQSDHEIEEAKLENIKNNIYNAWMNNELDTLDHEIFLDSKTVSWIDWKLAQD